MLDCWELLDRVVGVVLGLFKLLQQHQHEQVESDELANDKEEEEEKRHPLVATVGYDVLLDLIPILTGAASEQQHEGPDKVVEVVAGVQDHQVMQVAITRFE